MRDFCSSKNSGGKSNVASTKIKDSTAVILFNIDDIEKCNISGAANQHIRMISEGSCDTEDWSNNPQIINLASQE